MDMNTVLITGGAGFIGSNLCRELLKGENRVVVIDNLITSDGSNLKEFAYHPNFTFIEHDITHKFVQRIKRKIGKVHTIFHLACPTGVPNIEKLGKEMLETCTIGTMRVLELAKEKKARVLFSSSSEVYGEPLVSPQSESYAGNVDPLGPRSPYEEGKRLSESLIRYGVEKEHMNAVIVRIFNSYGPGMAKSDTRVIPYFFSCIKRRVPLQVHGDGMQMRTFCYIEDLIRGLLLIMQKGKIGEVYNLGSTKQLTILEVATYIQSITGVFEEVQFVHRPVHDHSHRLPDVTKVKHLGWKDTTDIVDGLERTRLWYGFI